MGAFNTILLVEDDHLLRRALCRLLSAEGYQVLDGSPGEQSARAELVVLGVGQGCPFQAVERLRQVPDVDRLPLLVLGGEPELQQQLDFGAIRKAPTGFLPQLYDGTKLLVAVRAFLAAGVDHRLPEVAHQTPGPS